ncbi:MULTISPECIES: DUF5713 family protein [unclassified Streptomyces]|jgi:hypothetical protein|uniref:DUF5713 family protein n=1 Tax=unclassified Streptomyces TaxID=2593676 RepID=UPI0029B32242|nr:DUF5713 family protein [Streptomyces sp. PA03-2a]MDX2731687.1 DUF5713 family protein [Streptomyces sp. PA03-2a]
MPITNQQVAGHAFLRQMYDDSYFPDRVVDQGKAILLRLCERVEAEQPLDLESLYALTQAATEEFNLLDREFVAAGSEIAGVSGGSMKDFGCTFYASGWGCHDQSRLVRRQRLQERSRAG